jgi:hypothetical protein
MSDGIGGHASILAQAAGAAVLGIVGAAARIAQSNDEKPMLRPVLFLRIAGDASLGLGMWLLLNALGFDGWWTFTAAWVGGALGYAAVHDLLLRVLNQKTGG